MRTTPDLAFVIETQDAVIRMQSGIIRDLYLVLLQHVTAEEAGELPFNDDIRTAEELKGGIEKELEGGR